MSIKYKGVDVGVTLGDGGGGATILSGTAEPGSGVGSNGDLYLKYYDSPLPSGYSDAEYLVFAGNQYFDTGILASTANLRVVTEMAVTTITTEAFWGGAWSESGYFFMAYANKFRWHSGGKVVDAITITQGQWYSVETTKTGIIIDGTTYALTNPSGQDSANNLVIGFVGSSGQGSKAYVNMKRIRVYGGDTLLADYIPAIDSNNIACYYDIVGQAAKYSAETAFASGGTAFADGDITAAYAKVSGAWQNLIGTDISDISGVTP